MPFRYCKLRSNKSRNSLFRCSDFHFVSRRFFSKKTNNNAPNTKTTIPSKYLTNGGIIEGVWIFHRHGDRAPNRYLGSESYLERESEHWSSRIPSRTSGATGPYWKENYNTAATTTSFGGAGAKIMNGSTTTAYQALSQYFPPVIHPSQNNGMFLDVDREPFGFLTWRGMDQMRGVGQRMRRRYQRFGYRVDNDDDDSLSTTTRQTNTPNNNNYSYNNLEKEEEEYSFLDHWEVKAYSTNYLRTVMSVQCFLDGLIAKPKKSNTTNMNIGENGIAKKYSNNVINPLNASHTHHDTTANNNNATVNNDTTIDTNTNNILYAGGGLPRYYTDYYRDVAKYEQLMHQDTSTLTTDQDMASCTNSDNNSATSSLSSSSSVIQVQVRDKVVDTLNAFDRFPQMMNGLVRDVIATERFQRIDSAAKPLAEKLSYYLEGLQGAPQAFGGTPSGINWIHANDHFVCRRAHSIPLTAFSDYEGKHNERDVEQVLASMANPVLAHLSWRFREWYRCPRLLAAVAAPPLKEVLRHMMETVDRSSRTNGRSCGGGDGEKRPFHIYSCHDVTLLSLLYGIGADFVVSGGDCGGSNLREEEAHLSLDDVGTVRDGAQQRESWRWWPAYSSTIALELVRVEDVDAEGVDGYVIRVILNGDTVRIIPRLHFDDEGILKEQPACSRQKFGELTKEGECQMLKLSDFSRMIHVMEQSGMRSSVLSSVEDGEPGFKEERRWQG